MAAAAAAAFSTASAVSGPSGSATAGFQTGAALGGYVGYSQSKLIGGELAYGYLQSNLSLKSGGASASFSGASHVIHYDLLFKTTRNKGKVQLFAAVGGGMKIFRGTGTEAAYQPLSQYGYFTKTQALKPMASVGGGVKIALTQEGLPARRGPRFHHGVPRRNHHSARRHEVRQTAP